MADSSKEGSGTTGAEEEMLTVPSPSFFDDIKFYISGNVSEKVVNISQSVNSLLACGT